METAETLYSYFLKAIRNHVEANGRGTGKVLAIEAGISSQMLSQVLNCKKKAGPATQKKLAKACGYPLDEFLSRGKKLIAGEDPGTLTKSSNTDLTKDVPSKVKVEAEMEVHKLLSHYKEMLAANKAALESNTEELKALREEIRYLREENRELKAEKRGAQDQTPQKKSNAV